MYGDLAPFALLRRLIAVAPQRAPLRGRRPRDELEWQTAAGSFLAHDEALRPDRRRELPRQGLRCGRRPLVFSIREERDRVRMCGGTHALLGADAAPDARRRRRELGRLHLTDELVELQQTLRARVTYCNRLFRRGRLPLLVENEVPIRFMRLGLPRVATEVAQRMCDGGHLRQRLDVPHRADARAGIRVAINANHGSRTSSGWCLRSSGTSPPSSRRRASAREEIDALFARSVVSDVGRDSGPRPTRRSAATSRRALPAHRHPRASRPLEIEHASSDTQLDQVEWDRLLGAVATCSARVDGRRRADPPPGPARPEHDWAFDYVVIRDARGSPVCATHFTTALQKDDFLMRDEVRARSSSRRVDDPYFLTSRVVMCGSTFSEGYHLYLDREGPWQAALSEVLGAMPPHLHAGEGRRRHAARSARRRPRARGAASWRGASSPWRARRATACRRFQRRGGALPAPLEAQAAVPARADAAAGALRRPEPRRGQQRARAARRGGGGAPPPALPQRRRAEVPHQRLHAAGGLRPGARRSRPRGRS